MLNEILYNKLSEVFGETRICNEDQQVSLTQLPAASVVERLGGGRHAGVITTAMVGEGGEHYAVCCPFCGDTRFRLWFCHAWGAEVEIDGNPYTFSKGLVHCYNEPCMQNTDNWVSVVRLLESVEGLSTVNMDSADVGAPPPEIFLPEGCVDITDAKVPAYVRQYLADERGYDLQELTDYWGIRYGHDPFYDAPSIIIPVFQYGRLAFWQSRYPGREVNECFSDGRKKPKYHIPKTAKKAWVLYNMDNAAGCETVVLVEGVFDCIRVSGNKGFACVGMFGTKPSPAQLKLLHGLWRRGRVIWIPDNNDPKSLAAADECAAEWNVREMFEGGAHVLRLPGQDMDPADHTREEIWRLIDQYRG